jgi:Na+-driven multidrug efflux pump
VGSRRPRGFSVVYTIFALMLYRQQHFSVSYVLGNSPLLLRRSNENFLHSLKRAPQQAALPDSVEIRRMFKTLLREAAGIGILSPDSRLNLDNEPSDKDQAAIVNLSSPADNSYSYGAILSVASTTMLIWLSEPLLSLVDTAAVGMTQPDAVVQIAAMGPATTLMDSSVHLCLFLSIATTSILTRAMSANDYEAVQRSTSQSLGVALVLGTMISIFVYAAGPHVLQRMTRDAESSEMIRWAVRYCYVRGITIPLAVISLVCQSFCIVTRDTASPVKAVLAATAVNAIGDILWTPRYGLAGTAFATALAVIASSTILIHAVAKQMALWHYSDISVDADVSRALLCDAAVQDGVDLGDTSKVLLLSSSKKSRWIQQMVSKVSANYRPLVSIPDILSLKELLSLSGPLFFNLVAKIICYSALTIRATSLGVVSLAAHNIMLRLFFFLGCVGYSLGQTTQSFLPRSVWPIFHRRVFHTVLRRMLVLVAVVALANSVLASVIVQKCSIYLTKNLEVIDVMCSHWIWLALSMLVHPFAELMEGVAISMRHFRSLVNTYIFTMGINLTALFLLASTLRDVWKTLVVGFQLTRLGCFTVGYLRSQPALEARMEVNS